MPRKRKVVAVVPEESEDSDAEVEKETSTNNSKLQHGPMYTIMLNAQLNEVFHNKYIKEMQQLYEKMDHDAFMFTFIKMLQSTMAVDETNSYANTTLIFAAKYVSSYDDDDTQRVLMSIFKWLLSTISNSPHIRYRICQFVNMILTAMGLEAALDDILCDSILNYMVNRLRDLNPNVRVQAILALQRLQVPDNPDDIIVKTYQFHLSSDPSPRVRQAVITSMGRNYNTIPYILERLWDIEEKVRRHTYLHMSSYPVKAYKVSQRLTFLEQGLNDRSDMVRKVVTTVMLPQWLESYNKDIISLITALMLNSTEAEIHRFRKITKMALIEIFKRQKKEALVAMLPLEEEGDYAKCVPFEKLTIQVSLLWLNLIEYLQADNSDELDAIIPELTTICNYTLKYCESSISDMGKWVTTDNQYILLTLMEIVSTFDLGDEIGRENLKQLIEKLLKNFEIEEHTIKVIIQCSENLITKQEDRLQFFVDIVRDLSESRSWTNELSHDRTLIEELLEKHPDQSLKFSYSALKVKILDLEEQETNLIRMQEFKQAQLITEERNLCSEEYAELLQPLLRDASKSGSEESRKYLSITFPQPRKVTTEILIKSLQISFYMVVSKKVKSLTPNVCSLYKDFIRRHIESNQIAVRDWAIKCGTAYSMLYEPLSKDVYNELYSQFYKNHNIRLWTTSIECIFELLDRYGCSHFEIEDKHSKSRKPGRQLYNTMESIDADEETSSSAMQGVDLIFMMSHFLDTCDETCILNALVNGFCRLVLHGHIKNDDIIEKLLLKYFNPVTESETNQLLGVFFENLIKRKKQEYMQPCLLPTISTIMSAPYDSPLHEIKPETVLRFVIDSTRPIYCSSGLNIHNTIALSFMKEMLNNISNKELIRILTKELITLEVSAADDGPLRNDLKTCCDKLMKCEIDPKSVKYIGTFNDILDGTFNPNAVSVRATTNLGSDGENAEDASDEEDENKNRIENETETEKEKAPDVNMIDDVIEEVVEETEVAATPSVNATAIQEIAVDASNLQPENQSTNEHETSTANLEKENTIEHPSPSPSSPVVTETPTTFGRDNTTNLRYLRKSMNMPSRISTEDSPKKPKIPISSEKRKRGRPRKVQAENTATPTANQNVSIEYSLRSEEKNDSESDLPPLILSEDEDEVVPPSQESEEIVSDSTNETDGEIPLSPNTTVVSIISRTRFNSANQRTNIDSQTEETTSIRDGPAKRRLQLFSSPQVEKGIKSNEAPRNESNFSKRDESKESNKKSTPVEKTKSKPPIGVTKSHEKRITTSKNPILKINRFAAAIEGRHTRNTSKRNFLFNTVVTRGTLSMEKSGLSVDLAIASPAKNRLSSNKENSSQTPAKKKSTAKTKEKTTTETKATANTPKSATKQQSQTIRTTTATSSNKKPDDRIENPSRTRASSKTQSARKASPPGKSITVTRSLRKKK